MHVSNSPGTQSPVTCPAKHSTSAGGRPVQPLNENKLVFLLDGKANLVLAMGS